jgi:transposase-like protein
MTTVEPTKEVSVEGVQEVHASTSRSDRRQGRRLSQAEALEIARLYAETNTPTAETRERFGIGDSSLYRIVQQRGIVLRGRTASSTRPNAARAQTPVARRLRSSSLKQAPETVSQPGSNEGPAGASPGRRVNGRSGGMRLRRAAVTEKTPAPSDTVASRRSNGSCARSST